MIRTAALTVAVVGLTAGADEVMFEFPLDGCQEVPSVETSGFGVATVVLDTESGDVSVQGVYQDLTGAPTAAHIHGLADYGQNAGVIVPLEVTPGPSGAVSGEGTLTPEQVEGMLDGLTYVNIHTEEFPAGEIRGQVVDFCPGDFNRDGEKNILDFVDLQTAFADGACEADINRDQQLNILDFVVFQGLFQIPCDE